MQPDIGSLPDQLPHIVAVGLLDEVVQTLTQQPVHDVSMKTAESLPTVLPKAPVRG